MKIVIDTSDSFEDACEIYWINGNDRCPHVFDLRGSNIYLQIGKLTTNKINIYC